MTRSTDSRRARNSASLTIGARRRPASRPSRRRCFLASSRVEPWSEVIWSSAERLRRTRVTVFSGSSPASPPSSPARRRRRRRRDDGLSPEPSPAPSADSSPSCRRRRRPRRRSRRRRSAVAALSPGLRRRRPPRRRRRRAGPGRRRTARRRRLRRRPSASVACGLVGRLLGGLAPERPPRAASWGPLASAGSSAVSGGFVGRSVSASAAGSVSTGATAAVLRVRRAGAFLSARAPGTAPRGRRLLGGRLGGGARPAPRRRRPSWPPSWRWPSWRPPSWRRLLGDGLGSTPRSSCLGAARPSSRRRLLGGGLLGGRLLGRRLLGGAFLAAAFLAGFSATGESAAARWCLLRPGCRRPSGAAPSARRDSRRAVRRRSPEYSGSRRKAFVWRRHPPQVRHPGAPSGACRGRGSGSGRTTRLVAVTDPPAASRSGDDRASGVPGHGGSAENVVGSPERVRSTTASIAHDAAGTITAQRGAAGRRSPRSPRRGALGEPGEQGRAARSTARRRSPGRRARRRAGRRVRRGAAPGRAAAPSPASADVSESTAARQSKLAQPLLGHPLDRHGLGRRGTRRRPPRHASAGPARSISHRLACEQVGERRRRATRRPRATSSPSGSASSSAACMAAGSTTSARAISRYSASLADPVGDGAGVGDPRVRVEARGVGHRQPGAEDGPLEGAAEVAVAGEPEPAALGVADPQPLHGWRLAARAAHAPARLRGCTQSAAFIACDG